MDNSFDSYKYKWARFVARQSLQDDLAIVSSKLSSAIPGVPPAQTVAQLAQETLEKSELKNIGIVPPEPGKFKVGIIGAGVAGLFTAMIFDWLHDKIPELDITYDILEAADENRLGGRLYTHKFSEKTHDYYDVGAMRFPENDIMNRTFRLFEHIGLEKRKDPGPTPGLIPYYMDDKKDVCPAYFNDVHVVGNWPKKDESDPFKLNKGLPDDDKIRPDLLNQKPGDVLTGAVKDFMDKVKTGLDNKTTNKGSTENEAKDPFWNLMMTADFMSTRQFLYSTKNPEPIPKGPGYNFNTVEWLETFNYGTGWYNQALTETVLEELDFAVDKTKDPGYWCIDGGAQQVATLMAAKLKKQPEFHRQVTAIDAAIKDFNNPGPVTLKIKKKDSPQKETESREYFAVFNSTTLGALQRMDLTKAGLLYGTKQAIRSLGYGASCKVGIKFKTPWWMEERFGISKGGLAKTDLPLRVCVYPSYNIEDPRDDSAVLLCSYTWAQDAQRIGTLISRKTPDNEEELKQLLFHNLALLHANEKIDYNGMIDLLNKQYDTHHAYDWYNDESMSGAFAYFGPGQFSKMWPQITQPNAYGRLYLVGEAASAHHAWIVGALESAVRAVYTLLDGLHNGDKENPYYKKAMKLLEEDDSEHKLPFHPLPKEMPKRQLNTSREESFSDHLKDGELLTHTAAVFTLAYIECLAQQIQEEAGSKQLELR